MIMPSALSRKIKIPPKSISKICSNRLFSSVIKIAGLAIFAVVLFFRKKPT